MSLRSIFSELDSKKRSLLDIGAGDGSITQKLMPLFDEITAIDILDSNIFFLKSLGINAKKCRWESYSSNRKYDVVLASHVLYYFKPENCCNEIKRMVDVLNPNGTAILIINSQEGEYPDFLNTFYFKTHQKRLERITSHEIINSLVNKGFNVEYHQIHSEIIFENNIHFLSLSGFLLDYDFEKNVIIKNELINYYENLMPLNNEKRKKMDLLEDLITIHRGG